jgi:hypothetical protein
LSDPGGTLNIGVADVGSDHRNHLHPQAGAKDEGLWMPVDGVDESHAPKTSR